MRTLTRLRIGLALLIPALTLVPSSVGAVTAVPVWGTGMGDTEKPVVNDAIKEWNDWFRCNDGWTVTITFVCDPSLTSLGRTSGWGWDPTTGRPTTPTVQIDNDAHKWTLGDPMADEDDALDTLKHEIGHALGFTVIGTKFAANVVTKNGNRFYDRNHNKQYDEGIDFDLIDDPGEGTHAPAGSGDLMAPSTPKGQRHHPTLQHALVLSDAYGYCVPEPSGMIALAVGALPCLVSFVRRRRCGK